MLKHKEPFSLILPIGHFSFFVKACLSNISNTCGIPLRNFDVVVLTQKSIPIRLKEAISQAKEKWDFRHVSAPFDAGNNHMMYIDWCIRNCNLQQWIILQHCDFMWLENNWLKKITNKIQSVQPNLFALAPTGFHNFIHEDKTPLIQLHDYLGVYNKKTLLENDWRFIWGNIHDLNISNETLQAIQNKKILWAKTHRSKNNPKTHHINTDLDWLDGSEAITIEAAVHCPENIHKIHIENEHLWQIFRLQSGCEIKNNTIDAGYFSSNLLKEEWASFIIQYSWMCSFVFDRREIGNKALPWKALCNLAEISCLSKDLMQKQSKRLEKIFDFFEVGEMVIGGEDDLGVKQIKFIDIDYDLTSTSTSSNTPNSTTQPIPSISSVEGTLASLKYS